MLVMLPLQIEAVANSDNSSTEGTWVEGKGSELTGIALDAPRP